MPELPELVIYAENLRPHIIGRSIIGVNVNRPQVLKQITPEDFAIKATGKTIRDVARRGKTLGFFLDTVDRIDVHLMIGGEMYYQETTVPEPCVTLNFHD